jgi:hypothetical protein
MDTTSDPTTEGGTEDLELTGAFYVVLAVPTLFGVAHHVDHVIRGNHVGWPLTPSVNAFTFSLAIYPLLALGLYLTATDRAGAGYWTGFFTFSAGLLTVTHLGPWAIEPPSDIVPLYAYPAVGYLAFAVLLGLIASVAFGAVYVATRWYRSGA